MNLKPICPTRCSGRFGGLLACRLIHAATLVALSLCIDPAGCRNVGIARQPGLNVLLITIDTLRADAVGAYGNQSAATPWIDRLAAGGVRFSQAHAQAVVTLPSHASILSGLYPFRHGIRDNAGFRLPESVDTLATILQARGYRTGAFVSAFPLDIRFGLGRGFTVYDDRYGKGGDHSAFRVPERRGVDTVAAARQWLNHIGQATPFFLWVHLYEPHFPYTPPEPFATRFKNAPYLGEVSTADAALGPLLEPVLQEGAGGRTLVLLTGDHGESLGEHGEMTHGLFAYEGTLHVPLVMFAPRLLRPRVVETPVRHVDMLPTILDALDTTPPAAIDGRSQWALASTGRSEPPPHAYFESLTTSLNRGWAPLYGIARGSLKYIDLPIPELYDLASDPSEAHNLFPSRPSAVREMQDLLAAVRAADRGATPAAESADTRERLRSLGYAATSRSERSKPRFTEADDPKRLITLDRAIDDVVTRYQQGDLRGAIALDEQIARQRPDMPLVYTHLAFLYTEAGDHRRAVDAIRRALELNPAAQDTAALFGAYYTEAGLAREAVARLQSYVDAPQPDIDVVIAYGVALASSGENARAEAAFERAGSLDRGNALPLVDLGILRLTEGDRTGAERVLDEAVRIDPSIARAYNALGVIAAERGDRELAIARWQHATVLDPRDYQAFYNLGDLLSRLGRDREAQSYWERYVRIAPPSTESRDIARVHRWLSSHFRK